MEKSYRVDGWVVVAQRIIESSHPKSLVLT